MGYLMCQQYSGTNTSRVINLEEVRGIEPEYQELPWSCSPCTSVAMVVDHVVVVCEHPWIIAKALSKAGRSDVDGVKEALDGEWGFPWEMPT